MSNIIDKIRVSGTDYTLSATSSGGNPTVELTQAEYDALVSAGTVSADTYYIITDAQAGDLTQYWTSAQTQSAITQAVSGKQDTLVSGTNIKTINNISILGSGNIDIQGGGGKAVSGGTNISITTGETTDTINCTLPISAGTGNNSIIGGISSTASSECSFSYGVRTKAQGTISVAFGDGSQATGNYSFATNKSRAQGTYSFSEGNNTQATDNGSHSEGFQTQSKGTGSHSEGLFTTASTDGSHTEGYETKVSNIYEHASGKHNNTVSASTTFGDSGNTLFSVGNGTSNNARHNAFEIRQNGDIYLTKDGQDVKLQDQLGGGGGITSGEVQSMIDESISGKTDESAFTAHTADTTIHVTSTEKAAWNAKSDFSGSYNDLTNKLSAGTNITIVDNVISATGGGGKAIVGGRGITVTSGETADTVSFNLPLSSSTMATDSIVGGYFGNKSMSQYGFAFGDNAKCMNSGSACMAFGSNVTANSRGSFVTGYYNEGTNEAQAVFGRYSVNNKANGTFGDSGNTLFSVGNGTSASARHNAFEIRQNGDIYCSDGTNDVKLQDTITATAANTTALGGLKLVKLTQAEYDALATKDSNTLYVIVN